MKPRRLKLNDTQQRWVRDWWRALQPRQAEDPPLPGGLWAMGRGERAQLRRCKDAEELLSQVATLLLAERLIALDDNAGFLSDQPISYERVAWAAGVLAAVKSDTQDNKSLAWHLGHGADNERPRMSELRFKAMQRSSTLHDLFRHWRRAVQLAEGSADVARLADDLLNWQMELGQSALRASDGIKFHWACDYYLSKREQAAAVEPVSDKELTA